MMLLPHTSNMVRLLVFVYPKVNLQKYGLDKKPGTSFPARDEPYEYHDPQFRLEESKDGQHFEDVQTPYIKHDTIHVIRVPAGKIGKVWFGNTPELLEARDEPYEFRDPQFRLEESKRTDRFEDVAAEYINHGTIHRVRVPQGKLAKVWFGTKPELLPARDEPYEFHDPQFRTEKDAKGNFMEDVINPYIKHDTIHFIRVPAGQLAKAWFGTTPELLPSRKNPYQILDSQFKLDLVSREQAFEDAYALTLSMALSINCVFLRVKLLKHG